MIIIMDGKHGSGIIKTAKKLAARFGIPCCFQADLPLDDKERVEKLSAWYGSGSFVYVGGAYSLGEVDEKDCIRIFLNADIEHRRAYLSDEYDLTLEEAECEALRVDRERARAYGLGTGFKWTDIGQYDLCIDTGKLGLVGTEELVNQLVAGLVMARRKTAY